MKVKKILGISFLVLGIIGFFYFTNKKNEKKVFNNRVSLQEKKEISIDLNKGQTYKIKFWGVDEEMTGVFEQPYFEAQIIIKNQLDQTLFNQELISITEIETGGKRVTHNGLDYSHSTISDESLLLIVEIKKGDYLDIDVYENLDSEADALPGIFIIIALIGLVIYFRSKKQKQ